MAKATDIAPEALQAPASMSGSVAGSGFSAPRGSLDPLILALTRAVDRQDPVQPSGRQGIGTD